MPKLTGIQKLRNGRYRARYFAGYDDSGKRIYPSATFDLESDAKDWLADERPTRSGGAAGHAMTVAELMDKWLTTNYEIRENSRRTFRTQIETHIKPHLGHIKIRKLSADQIEEWQARLIKHGKARATITGARSRLYSAFDAAVRWKLLRANPVEASKGVGEKPAKQVRHIAIGDEYHRFIEACASDRYGCFFELGIRTGLRFSELAGLTWEDVELNGSRGALRVRRTIMKLPGGGWRWSEPKSESGTRRVVITASVSAMLGDHRRAQLEQKLKAGPAWQDNDLLFSNHIGAPVSYTLVYYSFREVLKAAGLPQQITMHKLRHFYVTAGLRAGVDIKTISKEVGHSKPSFTLDHYGEADDQMLNAGCDARDALLRNQR